jgi:hypothetical protein
MISPCIYRVLFLPYYSYARFQNEPIIQFTFIGLISSILSIGFAIGVIIAVSKNPLLFFLFEFLFKFLGRSFIDYSIKEYNA